MTQHFLFNQQIFIKRLSVLNIILAMLMMIQEKNIEEKWLEISLVDATSTLQFLFKSIYMT